MTPAKIERIEYWFAVLCGVVGFGIAGVVVWVATWKLMGN